MGGNRVSIYECKENGAMEVRLLHALLCSKPACRIPSFIRYCIRSACVPACLRACVPACRRAGVSACLHWPACAATSVADSIRLISNVKKISTTHHLLGGVLLWCWLLRSTFQPSRPPTRPPNLVLPCLLSRSREYANEQCVKSFERVAW